MKKKPKFCECKNCNNEALKPPFEHIRFCHICKQLTKPDFVQAEEGNKK